MKNYKEKDLLLLEQLVLEGASQFVVRDASYEIFENGFKISKDNIIPSIEEWMYMGFTFNIVDDNTYLVYVPKNWKTYVVNSKNGIILDEKGNERVHVSCNLVDNTPSTTMRMVKRYSVFVEHDLKQNSEGSTLVENIYFGNPNEKLFYAGKVKYFTNMNSTEKKKADEKFDLICNVAKRYANAFYPKWKDVTAYWEKDSVLKQIAKITDIYDGKKVCFSHINSEDCEDIINGFNNGLLWEPMYEVPVSKRDDIDSYIEERLGVNNGIVFIYELPEDYDYYNDLIEGKHITKAKRLSTGTWFTNPENINYEMTSSNVENKDQFDRWLNYNRKRIAKYASLKLKLAMDIRRDYGTKNILKLKNKDK